MSKIDPNFNNQPIQAEQYGVSSSNSNNDKNIKIFDFGTPESDKINPRSVEREDKNEKEKKKADSFIGKLKNLIINLLDPKGSKRNLLKMIKKSAKGIPVTTEDVLQSAGIKKEELPDNKILKYALAASSVKDAIESYIPLKAPIIAVENLAISKILKIIDLLIHPEKKEITHLDQ